MKLKWCPQILFFSLVISGCASIPTENPSIEEKNFTIEENLLNYNLDSKLIVENGNMNIVQDINSNVEVENTIVQDGNFLIINHDYFINPNYDLLVYEKSYYEEQNDELTFVDEKLIIKDIYGNEKEFTDYGVENDIEKNVGWFDNSRLLINTNAYTPGTIILLNPKNGEKEIVIPEISDFYSLDPITWYEGNNPLPLYNRNMTLVFYLKSVVGKPNYNMEYVLFDIENEKEIWSKPVNHPQTRPMWSPDQSKIAFVARDSNNTDYELFMVDNLGHEQKFTEFSSLFTSTYISELTWSPSGNKIGYWLYGKKDEEDDMYMCFCLLDIDERSIIIYSIPQISGPILWSPNGNQIAFSGTDENDSEQIFTIVFDLTDNTVYRIANGVKPIGWLN